MRICPIIQLSDRRHMASAAASAFLQTQDAMQTALSKLRFSIGLLFKVAQLSFAARSSAVTDSGMAGWLFLGDCDVASTLEDQAIPSS
jgi:hypothetical protein